MIERFYAPDLPLEGPVRLEGDEAHHLVHVRRVRDGSIVELFDGRGRARRAVVRSVGRHDVGLEVESKEGTITPPGPKLTLATAVPKGDRFDWLVEKATEVGVARLIVLKTARSVVDPRSTKLDRLRRVVIEACKQSGRNTLMQLEGPVAWDDFLQAHSPSDPMDRFLADPETCRDESPADHQRALELVLAIGPEGGFDPAEKASALGAGWRRLHLGRHVLRVETAGVVGSALLLNTRRDTERGLW